MERVTEITSPDDPRIAAYRQIADPSRLVRQGLFVAEGRLVVQRVLALPAYRVQSVLVTRAAYAALFNPNGPESAAPIYVVQQAAMDQIVGFNIHRGCLALAERPPVGTLDDIGLATATRVVVLEGVNNPDNVGGIFRSALAFDADLVVLGPACGDPLYRKAIRTSMAATLDVPFVTAGPWPDAIHKLRLAQFRILALTPARDARPLSEIRNQARVALLLGTEGAGLTRAALDAADERVRIETKEQLDSLNVTVAASIALHHFYASSR